MLPIEVTPAILALRAKVASAAMFGNPMIGINYDDAVRALQLAVATQGPDFVYAPTLTSGDVAKCYYTTGINSTPGTGCVIGTALRILGVDDRILAGIDSADQVVNAAAVLDQLRAARVLNWTNHSVVVMFGMAQRRQDDGESWGGVFAAATRTEWTAP